MPLSALGAVPLLPAPVRAASTSLAEAAPRTGLARTEAASDTASSDGAGRDKASRPRAAGARAELTPEQQSQVAQLRQTDQKVRTHEAAHIAAGNGVVTSVARFEYTQGPDGKRYAVGGEVSIDTAREDEPQRNIDKGQRIQRAALAPAEPSSQDYRVAAVGAQMVTDGYRDLRIQTRDGPDGPSALGQRMAETYEAVAAQSRSTGDGGRGISLFA
ncbi:MAG: putative metalloprotease CJM1_0395 family protein [Burkholderiaceae bacterium]|nr:putative metalloprotease CJM1_0395 family protein [Burkholderiaceae bacterium]